MGKRKWHGRGKSKGGGKGKKKARNKDSSEKSKAKRPLGPMPQSAVLVTSHTPSQCQKATREAIRLLERLDELHSLSSTAPAEVPELSVGKALEEELAALKEPKDQRPFRFYCEISLAWNYSALTNSCATPHTTSLSCRPCPSTAAGVSSLPIAERCSSVVSRGVALLSAATKPSALVSKLFARQVSRTTGTPVRFVVRMAPLDVVCSPHLKNFQAAAEAELPKLLEGAREGAGWYCSFHSRAMGTIKREDAMQVLKQVMAPLKLELSVSEAEYMILIEVNPILCGFAVLKDYEGQLHECHLQNASEAFEHDAASEPLSDDEGSESEAPDEPDEPARAEETHEAE
ncbi:unnamed protein product [Durusdinium trenchii]|uniref:THUMP domain-containing protein n=2 Tax=Durusdinium trenchii TaxID=1381693 RepID=A0ABP0LJA5_9DINO